MLSVLANIGSLMAEGLEYLWSSNKHRIRKLGQILRIVKTKNKKRKHSKLDNNDNEADDKNVLDEEEGGEEEEEEEEDLRTFYNPDSSAEEETSDNTRYQPPYEVVISSLMPFGRPNLRGLLSYSGSKKLNRLVSRPPKNSIRRVLNVTETLFYATLNHSSPQVIALFAHDIVQECVQRTPFMPYQCQPHYDTMPNSSKKYFNFFGLF